MKIGKRSATLLAIAFALLMAIPIGGMMTAQAATPTELVQVYSENPAVINAMKAAGAEIFVDYHNGMYLLKVDKTAENMMANEGISFEKASSAGSLDMYPAKYRFNPAVSMPAIPDNLKATPTKGETGLYIVQFVGPIASSDWVKSIENAGGRIIKNIPKNALLVKMTPETANTVNNMPLVAWVGTYEPAYKISPDVNINTSDNQWVRITTTLGDNPNYLADYLKDKGMSVSKVTQNNLGRGSVMAVVPGNAIPSIAAMNTVDTITKFTPAVPLDLKASQIIGLPGVWYPSKSGQSTRYIGLNQIVGLQDTGYDEGDDAAGPNDHFQGPLGDRVVRFTDQGGKSKPDGNLAIGGEYVAHGSHCAGLISGNGWSWEKSPYEGTYDTTDYNWDHAETVGSAPGALLSLDGCTAQGTSAGTGTLSVDPKYWKTENGDGAYLFSNSWGSGSGNDYGGSATDADDDMDSDNAWLIFFAASNSGPNLNTLDPEANEKDGLVIGASDNYRPEWFESNNPNLMADFSSRGGPAIGDSRLKPDLVAPGTSDISLNARGEYQQDMNSTGPDPDWIKEVDEYSWKTKAPGHDGAPDYQYMQGTSMATPVATGAAAVIRQYLNDTIYHDNTAVPGYLIKALMINGAERMNSQLYTYPGYAQGWGRVNVKNSILPNPPVSIQHAEHSFSSTGTWAPSTINLTVASSDYPLKFTLTWVDTKGKDLSRDLDLNVTDPNGNYYMGNAYDSTGWSAPNRNVSVTDNWLGSSWNKKSNGHDGVNTVEQVEIEHPTVGTWHVQVIGANIPSTTNCALVVRGDIRSKEPTYGVNLYSPVMPTIKVDQGGTATLPVDIENAGKNSETFDMSNDAPSGLTVDYTYGGNSVSSYTIEPKHTTRTVVTISASSSLAPGVYPFTLTATSQHDTTRKGYVDVKVEVVDQTKAVAKHVVVADDSVDEMDPAVATYTDSSGTPWIFIAYVKPTQIYGGGTYGGTTVVVKYAQLNTTTGLPETWHGPIQLTRLNEQPTDVRIMVANGGNYDGRVFVIWTGNDPNATFDGTGSKGSWGRIAWADHSDYSSWTCPMTGTNTTIDENGGSQTYNYKRVNSIQYRSSKSQLLYMFEHLDYSSSGIQGVHNGYCVSNDGGSTWSAYKDSDPGGDYFFFPNLMDGGDDYNDVVWNYVYHRGSSGSDRDLSCQVYDDGGWGSDTGGATKETDVLDNPNNLQFPVVAYDKSSGSANHVFFAVLNDSSGNYQINVGYHSGAVSSSSPPSDTSNAWGTVKGPFATAVSDAEYNRRPIMNMISTPDDGGMWVQYIEKSTPLGPNIMALYSSDNFNTVKYNYVTLDSYGKGHEMSSETKIGSTDYVYTTYHMTKGDLTDVNYDIYLAIYHNGFENDPDTEGPEVLRETAEPTDYNATNGEYYLNLSANPSFELTATANDLDTGRSNIDSAEWLESAPSVTDPASLDWSSAASMNLTSGGTAVETPSAMITPSWSTVGQVHRIWIKATDSSGKSDYSYIDINVSAVPSMVVVNFENGWNMVSFPWMNTTTTLSDALSGLSWDRAMVYNNQNKVWYTYNTARADKYNLGFPTLDNTMGIWVHVTSSGSENGPTTNIGTTTVSLYKGWNLVGYPSNTVRTVSNALSGIPYDIVQTYNTTTGQIQTLADTDNMVPGKAYWIHVTADATWSVDW